MNAPVEDAEYVGEKSGVECPVCHGNILHVHEELPYVACPVCAVRGEITMDTGKMRVKWNEADAKLPRFSYAGVGHHMEWIRKHYMNQPDYFAAVKEITKVHKGYGTFISPAKAKAAVSPA